MRITALFLCFGLLLPSLTGCEVPDGDTTATAPDNSEVNERDADGDTVTPLDQGQGEADVERTAEIRSQVAGADGMSINAQNVKIITNNGKVTLRGPVASAEEKSAIERIAVGVAGEGNVTNQLEVAAND